MKIMKIKEAAILYNGIIYTGRRHHNIINEMRTKYLILDKQAVRNQGFITDDGQFVDRIIGAELAIKSGQIQKLKWPPNLYSEDLY